MTVDLGLGFYTKEACPKISPVGIVLWQREAAKLKSHQLLSWATACSFLIRMR